MNKPSNPQDTYPRATGVQRTPTQPQQNFTKRKRNYETKIR